MAATIDPVALERALVEIRPRLRGHAGDMSVQAEEGGKVSVHFEGACESCPAMAVTFAGLVRTTLLDVEGVTSVDAPQVHASPRALNRIAVALGATVFNE
ncbi:NifU family protein [Agromyces bauzanensis]